MSRWIHELLEVLDEGGVEAYDKKLDEFVKEYEKMNGIVRIGIWTEKFPESPISKLIK